MIERFIPQYWINLLRKEIQKTPIGGYVDFTDDFQNWGDTSVWPPYGKVIATHGMYFNFFVSDVDKLQPEKGFCEGIQGLILCGLIKI